MKRIYILLMVLCISLGFVGCDKDKSESEEELLDFYTNAKYIDVDYMHELLTFELLMLTNEKVEEVQVTELSGKGTSVDDFDIVVSNNSIDAIKNLTYRGMYPSVWYFDFQPKSDMETIEIEKITLLVNGKEHEVEFEKTLKLTNGSGTKFSGNMQPGVIPMEFPGAMINGELTPTYSFTALEDISIEKVYTNVDIVPTIEAMMINGVEVENVSYPIKINKDDVVEMNIGFSSDTLSKNNYILADIYVEYSAESNADCFKSIIMVSPIYPIMDNDLEPLKKYMDMIIGE